MISMGQWTEILGRDVPLIELQQWKTYRQRNIDSGWPARGQRFFIREMSVTHSSYEFPNTEMEIIFSDTPSTPLRISIGHGATVNEVLFQIWLLTEHTRRREYERVSLDESCGRSLAPYWRLRVIHSTPNERHTII